MKKLFLVVSFLTLTLVGSAQKYAVVDTRYILDRLPDYKTAQQQLDVMAAIWQKQIDSMQASLDKMYREFDAEQIMLTAELKKRKEDQLFAREKELRDLQRKRFGFEGDLFRKRQELVKPVQDKVYNAIQKMAAAKGYDFVLDKSEEVLKELGIR